MTDDKPVHLGTLETTGTAETDDGHVLVLETDQGEFRLTIDDLGAVHALSGSVERYRTDVMRGDTTTTEDTDGE